MSGYPWQTGDELLATDLNAAIANSIGLSSGTLPLNGSLPMTGPITLAGNATQPLHAVPLQQLSSTTASYLPLLGATVASVVADGTTDNTAALQAAINAAQSATSEGTNTTLYLPEGRILTGPLAITGQIVIEGAGSSATVLVLKNAATAPCITITPTGTFPGGAPYGDIQLRHLRIENQTIKTGNAAAHGVVFVTGTMRTSVLLDDVTIYAMPGDAINSSGFTGSSVVCRYCMFFNNLGNGVSCNSCNDWQFVTCQIGVNGINGLLLSGCTQFMLSQMNVYSNGQSNLYLYSGPGIGSGNNMFTDCSFDRAGQVGVTYDMRGLAGATFKSCALIGASLSSPGTYSDVLISSAANNLAVFHGCWWGNNRATDSTQSEKWALEFQGSTQTVAVDGTNSYLGGVLRASNFAQVYFNNAGGFNRFQGPASIAASQQYTGLNVTNGTNTIANLVGFSGTNDSGVLALLSAGTAVVNLSAASGSPSYINSVLYLGNGSTNAAPAAQGIRATGGLGTDIAGAGLFLDGGIGTGAGLGGSLVMRTAPAGTTGTGANTPTNRLTIDSTGLATFANNVRVNGNVGFYNTAPVAKPTASGAKGFNAALASVIAGLVALGLFTDTTTA